jgi:trans-aconitate methyltransferase
MPKWNPEHYSRHSSAQEKWASEVLVKLNLNGDEQILDIGCGDGKITAAVAQSVPRGRVVGLDSSPEMIEFARRSFPKLHCQLGDAREMGFHEEFDWVISFASLHWVIDHHPVLAGIRRALRPGGRVLLQFGGKGNADAVVQAMSEVIARPRWAEYFTGFEFPWGFYSPEGYEPWLRQAGLLPKRLALIPKDMTQEGPQGLKDWLRSTWMPYWERVPGDLRQEFFDQIVEEYLDRNPLDGKGIVHIPMVRLEVEATRG